MRVCRRGVPVPPRQRRRLGEQVCRALSPPGVERPLVPGEVVGEPAGGYAAEPRQPVPGGGARGVDPVEGRPVRGRVPLVGRARPEGRRRQALVEVAHEHAAPPDPAGHEEGMVAGRRAPPAPRHRDPGAAALVDRHRDADLVAAEPARRPVAPAPARRARHLEARRRAGVVAREGVGDGSDERHAVDPAGPHAPRERQPGVVRLGVRHRRAQHAPPAVLVAADRGDDGGTGGGQEVPRRQPPRGMGREGVGRGLGAQVQEFISSPAPVGLFAKSY